MIKVFNFSLLRMLFAFQVICHQTTSVGIKNHGMNIFRMRNFILIFLPTQCVSHFSSTKFFTATKSTTNKINKSKACTQFLPFYCSMHLMALPLWNKSFQSFPLKAEKIKFHINPRRFLFSWQFMLLHKFSFKI